MKPIDMTVIHSPPKSIGDCFRCCIASILELPAREVPHIYDGDRSGELGMRLLQDWLEPRELYFLEVEWDVESLKNWHKQLQFHHTISGTSPRGHRHAVVGFGGEMVFDPHPDRTGIAPDNGKYTIGFLVKR